MADQPGMQMIPPGVDPGQFYEQQRQALLAEMLTRMAASPGGPSPPQNYGTIRSRMTGLNPLSQMVSAMMARKAMDRTMQLGAANQRGMLGAFSNDPNAAGGGGTGAPSAVPDAGSQPPSPASGLPPASPGIPAPDTPQAGPGGGVSPGPPPAPGASIAPHAPPVAPGGGMPSAGPTQQLNPLNLHPALAAATYMRDPAKYAELVAGTPDWRTAVAATGGDIQAAQHLIVNKLIKEGVIELRQGGEAIIRNPDGTITRLRNPNLINGVEPTYTPQGGVAGAYVIPGMPQAERVLEAAKGTGKAEGEIHEFKTGGGGSTYSFGIPQNIPGAPPAFSGSGPSQQGAPIGGAGASPSPTAPAPGGGGRQWFPGNGAPPIAGQAPPGGAGPNEPVPPNVSPWVAKLPQRQNFNVGLGEDPFQEERLKHQAEKANELQDKYGAEADLADQRMAFNSIVLENLPNAATGPLSGFLTTVRSAAAQLGIPEGMIPGWATASPTIEMRKALVRNAIVTLKPNFGGRPAASEFQVLKEEANPSPEMTALAIKRLTEIDTQLAQMQKQRAADFDWAMANGKDPARFESLYAIHNPALNQIMRFLHTPTVQQLVAEKQRRQQGQQPPAQQAGAQ